MDFNDNRPIYLQLAEQIMDEAMSRESQGVTRLLSVRDFASKSGVNANTVMRAYTWLQQEGIIYNQRGIGYFYSPDARDRVLEMRRKTFFEKEIAYFMDRLHSLQVTPEQLAKIYKDYLNSEAVSN